MGLMLSVLVFCVGVLEALSCLEHIHLSYLPLEVRKRKRILVIDVNTGKAHHVADTRWPGDLVQGQHIIKKRSGYMSVQNTLDSDDLPITPPITEEQLRHALAAAVYEDEREEGSEEDDDTSTDEITQIFRPISLENPNENTDSPTKLIKPIILSENNVIQDNIKDKFSDNTNEEYERFLPVDANNGKSILKANIEPSLAGHDLQLSSQTFNCREQLEKNNLQYDLTEPNISEHKKLQKYDHLNLASFDLNVTRSDDDLDKSLQETNIPSSSNLVPNGKYNVALKDNYTLEVSSSLDDDSNSVHVQSIQDGTVLQKSESSSTSSKDLHRFNLESSSEENDGGINMTVSDKHTIIGKLTFDYPQNHQQPIEVVQLTSQNNHAKNQTDEKVIDAVYEIGKLAIEETLLKSDAIDSSSTSLRISNEKQIIDDQNFSESCANESGTLNELTNTTSSRVNSVEANLKNDNDLSKTNDTSTKKKKKKKNKKDQKDKAEKDINLETITSTDEIVDIPQKVIPIEYSNKSLEESDLPKGVVTQKTLSMSPSLNHEDSDVITLKASTPKVVDVPKLEEPPDDPTSPDKAFWVSIPLYLKILCS